jgi:hypothetical protein
VYAVGIREVSEVEEVEEVRSRRKFCGLTEPKEAKEQEAVHNLCAASFFHLERAEYPSGA